MSQNTDLKLLISAQNASTVFGGEAILPVHYFRVLAKRGIDVLLLCHERNRDDLTKQFPDFCDQLLFVPDTKIHKLIWRAGRVFPNFIRENVFGFLLKIATELHQIKIIKRLVKDGKINLVHQPMPVSPKTPTLLYDLGVPVVIGPMNGGMAYPEGYEEYESVLERRFVSIGRVIAQGLNRIIPGKHKAAAILVANDRTHRALPVPNHPNIMTLVENGVDLALWQRNEVDVKQAGGEKTALSLLFMGRLIELKGLDITIEALAIARRRGTDVRMTVVGDGYDRARLTAVTERLGMTEFVTFAGFVPQSECSNYLAQSDCLVLNSLRECGGAVVLEAMCMGIPVIVSDWGGPADYVDETCGELVSPIPRETFAERLSQAMERMASDPDRRRAMGANCIKRIHEEFDWEKKVDAMMSIYADTLSRR